MQIKFKRLSEYAILPTKATIGSAAFDLYVPRDTTISVGNLSGGALPNRVLCPTGIACEIPRGFVGLVCPRSGSALRDGLSINNSPGLIDSDYRGEIGVILINHGTKILNIGPGSRIGQLLILEAKEIEICEVDELDDTERGVGGFGSTGI